jgi:hypothetical protein
MDEVMEAVLSALNARHIRGSYAGDAGAACRRILELIPDGSTVGIGDSVSLKQLGALDALVARGVRVLDPFEPKPEGMDAEDYRKHRERLRKETITGEIFLTGTNALTRDGRLVNVDATGNRVAGMFWGHPLSIVVVGRNKIVRDLEEAFGRVRQVIAPTHFYVRSTELQGRKRKTPCATTGECQDCRSAERGCNIFSIIEGKPSQTELHVILVDLDLGLGWDPSWPAGRIAEIREAYKRCVSIQA